MEVSSYFASGPPLKNQIVVKATRKPISMASNHRSWSFSSNFIASPSGARAKQAATLLSCNSMFDYTGNRIPVKAERR